MRYLILLLFGLTAPTTSLAFNLSGNYWQDGQATYLVGMDGVSPSGTSWNGAFKTAMASWSDATVFEFIAIDTPHDPCIERGEGEFGDGVTGVGFRADVCGSEFGEGTVAITLTSGFCIDSDCSEFLISDADIVFNSNETWDVYSSANQAEVVDFGRVSLHELGHALGLDHETTVSSIMSPLTSNLSMLTFDDISGANTIYGSDPSLQTIYGFDVALPLVSTLTGPNDTVNLSGDLTNLDTQFEGKPIDFYQLTFEQDSAIDLQVSSSNSDTFLYLVRMDSTQQAIPASIFTDDNSGSGSNPRINQSIQAGSYWIGITTSATGELGSYSLSLTSSSNNPASSFETFESIYGVNVQINPNPNIKGELENGDFVFEGKFLDIYQFDVAVTSNLQVDLSSTAFDAFLVLISVDANQQFGDISLTDDDGGLVKNSRLQQSLPPGSYWIGVTSFAASEAGDYNIDISVIIP